MPVTESHGRAMLINGKAVTGGDRWGTGRRAGTAPGRVPREGGARGVFCALGRGDVDIDGVLAGLRRLGYSGWVVVEQDRLIADVSGFEQAVADQRANRSFLAERGL